MQQWNLTAFFVVSYAFIEDFDEPGSMGIKDVMMNKSERRPTTLTYYPENIPEKGKPSSALIFSNLYFTFFHDFSLNKVDVRDVLKINVKCAGNLHKWTFILLLETTLQVMHHKIQCFKFLSSG